MAYLDIEVPELIARKLEDLALENNVSVNRIVNELLEVFFAEQEQGGSVKLREFLPVEDSKDQLTDL